MFVLLDTRNKVAQIASETFPVHPSFEWVEVTEEERVDIGYSYIERGFIPPEESLEPVEVDLTKALADIRYEKEVGGLLLEGFTVSTIRETRADLIGIRIKALEDPTYTVKYKAGPTTFVTLDADQIIAAADSVANHVQACFSAEANIDVSLYESVEEVREAFETEYLEQFSSRQNADNTV